MFGALCEKDTAKHEIVGILGRWHFNYEDDTLITLSDPAFKRFWESETTSKQVKYLFWGFEDVMRYILIKEPSTTRLPTHKFFLFILKSVSICWDLYAMVQYTDTEM